MVVSGVTELVLAAVLSAAGPTPKLDADVICVVNGEPLRLGDIERALFFDEHQHVEKNVLPFLVQERVVRQTMSDKGVSVRPADVDGYLQDLDRQFRQLQGKTLTDYLRSIRMDHDFFRRKLETTLGLFYLAGGKGRPSKGMSEAGVQTRMNAMVANLVARAKVVSDLKDLPEGVAATVNGEKITIAEAGRVARMSFPEDKKKMWVHQLQRFFIVRQELSRRGLKLTADDLDYQIKLASSARTTRIGEVEFPLEKILEKLGRDVDLLKMQCGFQRVAMLTKMVRAEVTDKQLRALFEENPARFGDGVPKASHILIKTVDDKGRPLSDRDQRRARKLAEAIYKRLTGDREDFAKLAGECSQDPKTRDRGGEVGYQDPARRGKLDSTFPQDVIARTAYALKAGEVSRPVFSRVGWHLVKVTELHRIKFEEAKPLILAAAVRARRNVLEAELIKKTTVRLGPAKF